MQVSDGGSPEEGQGSGNKGAVEKSPGLSNSHAVPSPVHGEMASRDVFNAEERENGACGVLGCRLSSKVVGPDLVGGFKSGAGEDVGRPKRRSNLGQKGSKAQTQPLSNSSPEGLRPRKRTRNSVEDDVPGFGFVGFTANLKNNIDLNTSAQTSEAQVGVTPMSDLQSGMAGATPDLGADTDKEVENTINIGAQVGVDFGQKLEKVSIFFGSSGNNGGEP
ncbi:hypothetical protein Hanom_Chr16g01443191 [Helianthus anomalus]